MTSYRVILSVVTNVYRRETSKSDKSLDGHPLGSYAEKKDRRRVDVAKKNQKDRFEIARSSLVGTDQGQEATMYGHLRDLFVEVLCYPPQNVDIDRAGARGRPDITVFAPGATDSLRVAWIVLEAKDEHDACRTEEKRKALFSEKSKYITADTAWFIMVDPTTLVARPVDRGGDASADIVLDLATITYADFLEKLAGLHAEFAGVPKLLSRFRDGDENLIAVDRLAGTGDKLSETLARNAFFDGLEETTQHLQAATLSALTAIQADRVALVSEVKTFSSRFNGHTFSPYPVQIAGRPKSREEAIEHGREAHRLNRLLGADPAMARLALKALPSFAERTGINPEKEADKLDQFFATETANLILARILLIRFLEDHGFFDETTPDGRRQRRYLCNGGVQAFQGMREYFNARYTRLLEDAYRSGAKVYAAAFNETEHDWVLDLADDTLSRNIEWAMYRFARFDFTSIRGDILTGIYDRFLDPKQRKAQGEYYTPPSIARYMLDRLGLNVEDSILDPSCGSGTFLIERYQQAVGEDADRGLASYEDARDVIQRICGNDLNPFSAVLTQIQLLWHLLSFGKAIQTEGVPAIHVAERANSLVPTNLRDQTTTRFGDIDAPGYAAVVGNPPYIRPERGQALESTAHSYYTQAVTVDGTTHAGISPESNPYNLFIYRALDYWCSVPEGKDDRKPGKLAFVIPLGFCVANNSADLRTLFAPGGRWTITEIVDMELIWRHVFDADVLPMILFAEARPPTDEDQVTVRHVDETSVRIDATTRKSKPVFDLSVSPENKLAYADLFTPEGRIATRLTPARASIVKKLRALGELSSAAKTIWTKRKGGYATVDVKPTGMGEALWEEQRMIGDGVARRGKGVENAANGLDIYKGENIRTGSLVGDPQFKSMDVWNLSSPSLWKNPDILPDQMWCFPILEQVPCAAPFDPKTVAVTNTATVFGPRPDLEEYPFDVLLTSRIYGWITLLSLRSSYQNKLRSHMYPATIGKLPWSEELTAVAADLNALRGSFFQVCRARHDAGAELTRQAQELPLKPLRTAFKKLAETTDNLEFSKEFDTEDSFSVTVEDLAKGDNPETIVISEEGHSLTLPSDELADYVRLGLAVVEGEAMTKQKLLNLPVPEDAATASQLRTMLATFDPIAAEADVQAEVDKIDQVVGAALGLTPEEIAFVQTDMRDDPFLSRVRPRYPFFTPKIRGRRRALERADRYQ